MADSKRAERRRKRRKGAAAGRPANYSQLYKGDNEITVDIDDESADGSELSSSAGAANVGGRASGKSSDSIDWQGEYRYVLRDLRTVLVVSLLIFAVMIGVGVFL